MTTATFTALPPSLTWSHPLRGTGCSNESTLGAIGRVNWTKSKRNQVLSGAQCTGVLALNTRQRWHASRWATGEHAAVTEVPGERPSPRPHSHPHPWRAPDTGPRPTPPSPCSPFPLALVQEGGGEAWGRTTGAKALFCFTAEMTLAGENEKMPCVLLQFEGRVTEEAAMVGLDGTTATKQTRSARAAVAQCHGETAPKASPQTGGGGTKTKHDMRLARPRSG